MSDPIRPVPTQVPPRPIPPAEQEPTPILASLACRSALAKRGVAHLSIASDVQEFEARQTKRSKRVIKAVNDAYEPMMPPKMPPDYQENFRKALPDTPGHDRIEDDIREESLRMMMAGESTAEPGS
jgi:hypothetical protein